MTVSASMLDALVRRRFPDRRESERHYQVNCPFCPTRGQGPDTKKKLYISKHPVGVGYREGIRCWRCNTVGPITLLFPALQPTAAADLWPAHPGEPTAPPLEALPAFSTPIAELPSTHPIRRYLTGRGIPDPPPDLLFCYDYRRPTAQGREISYGPRIIFPVMCAGHYQGFHARAFGPRLPKYVNSDGLHPGQVLYNWDRVFDQLDLTIVEGVFDAFAFGLEQVVASFGKALSDTQVRLLLSRDFRRYILLYDADALANAKSAAAQLARYRSNVWVGVLPWKDPSAAGRFVAQDFVRQGQSAWRSVGLQKVA